MWFKNMFLNSRFKKLLASFFILLIASCGGGGGSAPIPTVTISVNNSSVPLDSEVTITWSSSSASSCQASGSWSGVRSTSGSEVVTISLVGNNTFFLNCSGNGGTQSSSVVVEGYRQLLGVTVDGYIRGAEIFIDQNNNYQLDAIENSFTSNNNGEFALRFYDGTLISKGGIDLDTGTPLNNLILVHKMNGFSDFKVISPISSVSSFLQNPENINLYLGIDQEIDINIVDPVLNKGDESIYDYLYEKNNQLTVIALSLSKLIKHLFEANSDQTVEITTRESFILIASHLRETYAATDKKVDIESLSFIQGLTAKAYQFTDNELDLIVSERVSSLLANLLPVIEVKNQDYLTTATFGFSLSTFLNDFQNAIEDNISSSIIELYNNDILSYIGDDQSVDSDLLAPEITAFDNSANVDEDNLIEIDVLANDSFLSSAPISISANNPENGVVSIIESTPPRLSYLPNQDFFGTDEFQYMITQGNKTSVANVEISINPVNDAPVINISSTLQAPENQNFVGNISVFDVDGDPLELSYDGADKLEFNLDENNNLYFVSPPDYEGKNIFYLLFSLTDGQITVTKEIDVLVTNVNDIEPVINTNSLNAREMCSFIDYLDGSDVEGDVLEWSISEESLDDFSIDKDSGELYFIDAPRHDPEIDNTRNISVTVFDGVHTVSKNIVINLSYDPLFPHQWVLENTGQKNFADLAGTAGADSNILDMDCKYSGEGVIVSIVDEGLELLHEDLKDNIIEGSYDWVENDSDPTNTSFYGDHGTSVSGIIAMKGHNNLGGRGIAPNAKLVGYNWLLSQSDANLFSSFNGLDYSVNVGVSNNSWGRGASEWYMPPSYDADTKDAMVGITQNSRSGKGTVFVKSNGNSWAIGGYCGPNQSVSDEMPCTTTSTNDPISAIPYFVGVPSLNADDERSSYSTPGSASWISGYGGEFGYGPPNYYAEDYSESSRRYFKAAIVSTDQSTCEIGYVRTENDAGTPRNALSTGDHPLNLECNYLPHMNGTSSAGPTVAGLVALLLEVNPDFTWRDIKHILASTASKIDLERTKSLIFNDEEIQMYSWIENAAGYNFHNWFGFGKLNISNAINFAENLTPNNLGEFITYDIVTAEQLNPDWDLNIADQKLTDSITLESNPNTQGKVEWIRLRLWFDYPDMSDIGLRLTSPDGTTLNVLYPFAYKINNPKRLQTEYEYDEYYFEVGVAGFYGENLDGQWTLEVINWESGGCPEETDEDGNTTTVCTTGILENWGIIAYGN